MSNSKSKSNIQTAPHKQSPDMISCLKRKNYIIMILSACLIVLGFCLMAGPSCTMEHFNPDVFSTLRTAVAPTICLFGYLLMTIGIMA